MILPHIFSQFCAKIDERKYLVMIITFTLFSITKFPRNISMDKPEQLKNLLSESSLKRGYEHMKAQKFRLISKQKQRNSSGTFSYITEHIKQRETQEEDDFSFKVEQKEYNNLSKKLAEKKKMKIGTRNFNKSFYSKLANKIIDKPLSFYKFGLKEEDKKTCKTVFRELFKISPEKLKGSLSITDLWDNKTSIRYLKQNEMFFNKDILIQQFQSIDKEQKQRKRQLEIQKQKQFVQKYREMVEENRKLNQNNVSYQYVKEMNAKEACSFIRTEINKLVDSKYHVKKSNRGIMAGLQKDYDKFDQIACKFKNKMMVLL